MGKEVKIMIIERSLGGLNSGEFSDRINELEWILGKRDLVTSDFEY